MTYVYIYLNEKEAKKEALSENEKETTQYEYDYNEFKFKNDTLDINDIKEHPENYMDEVKVVEKVHEASPTLEERVSAIEEILLADMGGNES
jgi:hypothetical protein